MNHQYLQRNNGRRIVAASVVVVVLISATNSQQSGTIARGQEELTYDWDGMARRSACDCLFC